MAIIAFSPARSGSQEDLHPFERLAVSLSSSFSSLQADEVEQSVVKALDDIGTSFDVDECTLIVHREIGSAKVVSSWAAPPHPPCTDADLASMPWLVQRLSRNTVVAITPTTDVPHAALKDREHAEQSGISGRLGVPIVVGTRVVYGLIVGSRQRHPEWRGPVVERLRLVGEILGAGLARVRQTDVPGADRAGAGADPAPPADEPRSEIDTSSIIGNSGPLQLALERLAQVAPLDATVLLLGETGTGKELFARALHDSSRRRGKRLIPVNCAALPASLIESELFGHERGAFTGAATMRQGRFELADEGTIFLDEVGDLALDVQAKLLRVLQEGEFERVGSSKTRRVNVRVIAATHVDLEDAVAEGGFRADLYYRLSVFPITLPPLRERPEDIPQLVWFFLNRHRRDLGRQISSVPAEVMEALQQYDWPGNVRELENVIARAMIHSSGGTLQLDGQLGVDRTDPRGATRSSGELSGESDTLDAVQRTHIERVLRECGWRINGAGNAAVRLGLHPNTLRFRIKKLGLTIPGRRGGASTRPSAVRSG
jgi:transcriptional regulator with GAF, ATPase, and Fis domain